MSTASEDMPASWDHSGELPYRRESTIDPFFVWLGGFVVVVLIGIGLAGAAWYIGGKPKAACACVRETGGCACRR